MRRGYWFFPKHLFGKPSDVFAHGGPQLPLRLEQLLLTGALKLLVGDITHYGLPAPDHRVLESHPIMNTQVLHYIGQGDLVARGDIAELRGDRVLFGDGTEEPFDLIVWATGYEVSLPFLERDIVRVARHPPRPLPAPVPPLARRPLGHGPLRGRRRRLPDPQPAGQAARLGDRGAALGRRARRALGAAAPRAARPLGGTRHVDSPRHDISIQDAAYKRHVRALLDELEAMAPVSASA